MNLLHQIPGDVLAFTELGSLSCRHAACMAIRAFDTFEALIYHLTVTHHSTREAPNRCHLCSVKPFSSYDRLRAHMRDRHTQTRQEHLDARNKLYKRIYRKVRLNTIKKKAFCCLQKQERARDHRSISPDGYAKQRDEEIDESASDAETPEETPMLVCSLYNIQDGFQPFFRFSCCFRSRWIVQLSWKLTKTKMQTSMCRCRRSSGSQFDAENGQRAAGV